MSVNDDIVAEIVQALSAGMILKGGGNAMFDDGERLTLTVVGAEREFFRDLAEAMRDNTETRMAVAPTIILPHSPMGPPRQMSLGDAQAQLTRKPWEA